jgi:hypothetical protein
VVVAAAAAVVRLATGYMAWYMYMNASMNLLWMRSGKCMRQQKCVSAGRVGVVWRGSEVERDEGST